MKTRIAAFDLGRISPLFGEIVYVIECKPHWWSRWKIRDWSDKLNRIPTFYESIELAKKHL